MTNAGKWVVGTVVTFAALFLIWAVGFAFSWWSTPWQGKLQARQQILGSGSYRISSYEHFFDLCASIQTKEGTITALRQELTTHPSETRREQINASVTANEAGRIDDINQYNVDAEKSYTQGQFRASKLPYHLDPNDKETECTS